MDESVGDEFLEFKRFAVVQTSSFQRERPATTFELLLLLHQFLDCVGDVVGLGQTVVGFHFVTVDGEELLEVLRVLMLFRQYMIVNFLSDLLMEKVFSFTISCSVSCSPFEFNDFSSLT